jgi:uncharacterized protein YbjT (DUF2867 family)
MRVAVIGAGGFIGRHIVVRLRAAGHSVVCAGRHPATLARMFPDCDIIKADLSHDTQPEWTAGLQNVDALINAAGILRGDVENVQHLGTLRLFDACAEAKLACVLHISALGASIDATGPFLRTKGLADAHLVRLAQARCETRWLVLRPSLVIGRGGASTSLFSALSALPNPVRLGKGKFRVQPIHVNDFAGMFAQFLDAPSLPPCLDIVGPDVMTTDDLTSVLRCWLGLKQRPFLPIPDAALRIAGLIGSVLPNARFSGEALRMLEAGAVADETPQRVALGWRPRGLVEALAEEPATRGDLWQARFLMVSPFLLVSLSAVWIGTGTASAFLPASRSSVLLAGLGLGGFSARVVTWAGASLDIALGLALLHPAWRNRAALAQLAIMSLYTALATIALPMLWADPFAPLLKNLAVCAATFALLTAEA